MNDFRPNRPCEESLKIWYSTRLTAHTAYIYISHSNSDENITQCMCIHTHTHTLCVYFHFSSFISILFLIRFSSISFVVQEIECNATTKSISIESSSKCITSIMYSCIDYTDTTTLLPDSISSVWLRASERPMVCVREYVLLLLSVLFNINSQLTKKM